jgi:hypothetical protein
MRGSDDIIPIIGVSLGERFQSTGISVTERTLVPNGEKFTDISYGYEGRSRFEVREPVAIEYRVKYLERHGPPTRYSKVAQRIARIAKELETDNPVFVADITATGTPTYHLIMEELKRAFAEQSYVSILSGAVTVTNAAGGVNRTAEGDFQVPRRTLLNSSQILFDTEPPRLKIAKGIGRLTDILVEEFASIEPKKREDLDAWRVGKDDDLLFAVACGIWACERFLIKPKSRPAGEFMPVPR